MGCRRLIRTFFFVCVLSTALVLASGCAGSTPKISAVTPQSGKAGTQVQITGSNFSSAQGTGVVHFGDSIGEVVAWSDTEITVKVPAGITVAATYPVSVLTKNGQSNEVQFTVEVAAATPKSSVPKSSSSTTTTQPKQQTQSTPADIQAMKNAFGGDTTGWTFRINKVSALDPNWEVGSSSKTGYQGALYLLHKENGTWVVKVYGTDWNPADYGAPSDMTPS
jgi:hypothetical protein